LHPLGAERRLIFESGVAAALPFHYSDPDRPGIPAEFVATPSSEMHMGNIIAAGFNSVSAEGGLPVTGHLHVHDSFGRPQGLHRTYLPQEDAALGLGDLHIPLGWGDIEWDDIFSELVFLPGTVLMMGIGPRYRNEQPDCPARAKNLIALNNRAERRAAE
jgi:hypothetical protein